MPPAIAPPVPRAIVHAPVTRPEPAAVPAISTGAAAPASDFELALYYHRAGDFENALQHYRALLQKNELDAQAHNNLGLLYQSKNLLDESARELQRAILIEPRNARAHNNYGVTLLGLRRIDEAAAEFRVALELEPRNVDALVNLALAQKQGDHADVAKETLLRALAIAPRSAEAHYNLGLVYDETNEPARAIDHYRRFLDTAGPERADRVAAVRARIAALSRIPD
jgi:Tfp pilus assembly protein PilF